MKKRIAIHKTLFTIILVILSLPATQLFTQVFKIKELKGWFITYEKPPLAWSDWKSGEFQDDYNNYFENNIGFRPYFVRIRNQLAFSINHEAKAAGVEIGKDYYLYEQNYLDAATGKDFLGYPFIKDKVDSLIAIRDSLLTYNTNLIICLAVGKGSFYPNYFPEAYQGIDADSTNYKTYRDLLARNTINLIDFNGWFLDMKDTSSYPLYPKYGIHWSEYGAILAADSLLKYVENLRNVDLPDIIITSIDLSSKLEGSDYDMGESLNLIFQLPSEKMAYPRFKWNSQDKDTIKAIVVSDSFYWQLFNMGVGTVGFQPGGFWYYNKVSHPGATPVNELNYRKKLMEADVVILMATEATLPRFPFGFMADTYNAFSIP